jgi:hypothetical protein
MTVAELIKKLEEFNPKAEVMAIPPFDLKDDRYLTVADAEEEYSHLVSLGLEVPNE